MKGKRIEEHLLAPCIVFLFCFPFGFCGTLLYIKDVIVPWNDARSICQNEGLDLVVIEDSTEMAWVNQHITDNGGYIEGCWTGGYWDYGIGGLSWADNSEISYLYSDWDLGEPDCLPSDKCGYVAECVRLTMAGKLRTTTCFKTYSVICEAATYVNCQ